MSSDGISPTDHDTPVSSSVSGTLSETKSGTRTVSGEGGDREWLTLAQQNYTAGITYLNAALTDEWERNFDHWNSNHYRRSAYNTKAWRGRSALFRPLTRASERSSSATAAAAFFANKDIVSIVATNPGDPSATIAAKWMQNIVQYRLKHSLKWYMNCMGAWQNTRVYGPCISIMDWIYEEDEIDVEEDSPVKNLLDMVIPGRSKKKKAKRKVVLKDQPVLHLLPVENVLYDPASDWTNPAQDTSYLTVLYPMYVTDVENKMSGENPEWIKLDKAKILSATRDPHSTVRQAREGDNRPDSTDAQSPADHGQMVWPRLNFVRKDGVDWTYWTLGHEYLLTDPKPVIDEYEINERPVVIGCSVIETFQMSPSSPVHLIAPLQMHVNDISNLRLDNIRLALNKRYILRRGAVIDLEALMLNIPGGAIATDDPERDVKVIQTSDVTGSSYKEQERLETEANDVFGVWLGGSIQNNRSLRETVGGMEMLKEGKSELGEFDIRTFAETWVKPTLQMLVKMIQAHETDVVIMNFAWDQTMQEIPAELRIHDDDDQKNMIKEFMMNNEMVLEVNVGLGATSPEKKIAALMVPIKEIGNVVPGALEKLNFNEIWKEVMAASGHADGARFLQDEKEVTQADVEQAYQQGLQEGVNQDKIARIEMEERVAMEKIAAGERISENELLVKLDVSAATLEAMKTKIAVNSKDMRDIAAGKLNQQNSELAAKKTGAVKTGI